MLKSLFRTLGIIKRKPVNELTIDDFNKFPVWEFALDEEGDENQDETTVRPFKPIEDFNPDEGLFIVKAKFTYADGTTDYGYLTPPNKSDDSLGRLQPVIITNHGQVYFWCGSIKPSKEEIAGYYSLLGKKRKDIFPIVFESTVEIFRKPIKGSISGFIFLENWKTGKTKVIL